MRLVSLTVAGYRQFSEAAVLDVPRGLTGICGPNGVGKSKLIEAIGYALYGWQSGLMPRGDRRADLPSRGTSTTAMRVELVLELWGQHYQIVRSQRETTIRLVGSADALAASPTGVTTKVIELLGLTPAAFAGTFVARQREVAGLQALPTGPRRRLVNRLIGIAQVEAAIALAEKEHAGRKVAWKAVADLGGSSPEQATAELETSRRTWAEVTAAAEACEAVSASAAKRADAASKAALALQERSAEVASLRERVADNDRHRITLERELDSAQGRVSRAMDATRKVAAARAVICETAHALEALERQQSIADVATLRRNRLKMVRDLDERLGPQSRERSELGAALADDETVLQTLQKDLAGHAHVASIAEGDAQWADEAARGFAHRAETARELGPDGICDVCGQAYGASLEHALAHFADEAAAAQSRAERARRRLHGAQQRVANVEARITARTTERNERRARLETYDTVPGEKVRAREQLRQIDEELAAMPGAVLTAAYVPGHLAAAEATIARRTVAETTLEQNMSLADDLGPAQAERESVLRDLADLARRRDALCAEIARIEPTLKESRAVAEELVAAEAEQSEARSAASEARDSATAWETRVALDSAALDQARERAEQLALAHGALRVAERTEEVMRRLLIEIAAEARPRLVDMLDGWMRALLGTRFRGIDLTEDYRIRADSGSGWHEIEHFSGGEQTLLAIMLRVAISLFCQERAGFDRGFLILDEVFGDQDGEHRAQLVQFLGEIKEQYHQVLVVNHVEDVTEMLDSIIDVQPVAQGVSTASVRR